MTKERAVAAPRKADPWLTWFPRIVKIAIAVLGLAGAGYEIFFREEAQFQVLTFCFGMVATAIGLNVEKTMRSWLPPGDPEK